MTSGGYSKKGRTTGAVLDEQAVRNIRSLYAQRRLYVKEQADLYGVTSETIRRIARWETWKHVLEEDWATPEALAASVKRTRELAGLEVGEAKSEDKPEIKLNAFINKVIGDNHNIAKDYSRRQLPLLEECSIN